ncbi:MAG: hypothetical protein ACK2T6_08235 [Anaerolineae bacterium]
MQIFEDEVVGDIWNPMADAGARYARMRVLWSYIEPVKVTPPVRNWTVMDELLGGLAAAGFTPIGEVFGHPDWAATEPCGPIDLVPLSRYGDFIEALVERYDGDGTGDAAGSPRIAHWEIGNEADFDSDHAGGESSYGSCFGGKAEDYGAYLREAYLAAKRADSTATVLFGGVAYDRFYNKSGYSPAGPFDYRFVGDVLDWLYAHHGSEAEWPFFDWMAVHVYNDFRNAWDGTQPYDQELIGKTLHFRTNQLLSVGDYDLRAMPLAVSESSLPSMPSDDWTVRSEDIQAAYPGRLLARSMKAGVEPTIWYTVEDYTGGDCDELYDWLGFGVLRSLDVYEAAQDCSPNPIPGYSVSADHEPKPAHTAYSVAADQLDGAAFDAQVVTAHPELEAYRFEESGGGYMIVAFTDNGERLGRRGYPPVVRQMTLNASNLPGWTGTVAITDYLGNTTYRSGGSFVNIDVTQWPVYVRPY